MRIMSGTDREYAYIELDEPDFALVNEFQKQVLGSLVDLKALRGLRIEVSAQDRVPENVRSSLAEGRFFVVE
jgi:hypothetical protein